MDLLDTSSPQCKILTDGKESYVIRYPRDIGPISEYYRFTPESDVINLLEKNDIRVPKIIKTTSHYFVQEYIEGSLLSDIFQDHNSINREIIKQIIEQICHLTTINYDPLLKYASWNDNRNFYIFQCKNTEIVFQNYYQNLKELYDKLGISLDILSLLCSYSPQIDNNRNLSIIHGDRHKKNIILQDNKNIVFIDWELGGVGDLAYDIAFHLHQMAYTKEDETFFIHQLKEKYVGNFASLEKDIELYRLFVLARSCIYHVYWTNLVYRTGNDLDKKKQLKHFMKRYNRLSKFSLFNLSYKSEEELEDIFKKFTKSN